MTGGAKSTAVCASIKHARARERAAEAAGGGSGAGQRDLEGGGLGNVLSPPRRRQAVDYVRHHLGISERRACRVLDQPRSTHRHRPRVPDGECRLVARLIELATQSGRYGYRRITARLRGEGWRVHHKRVARLWRREGLNVPQKQPTRGGCGSRTVRVSAAGPSSATRVGVRLCGRADTRWPAREDSDGRG